MFTPREKKRWQGRLTGWAVLSHDVSAKRKPIGIKFAAEVLPRVVRPEAIERICWHKTYSDIVVVVSGALDIYLGHWCNDHGVQLICSSLEHRNGVLTGRYHDLQCVCSEKAGLVTSRFNIASFDDVFAYGDTVEDRELLALASRKFYQGRKVSGP